MKYFVIIDDKQCGPFTPEEMPSVGVRPSTYVWCKGMEDWKEAREVAEICRIYRNRLFDLQHPNPTLSAVENPSSNTNDNTNVPTRFQRYISPEDIQPIQPDTTQPPIVWTTLALLTSIFFLPTGIMALYYSRLAIKQWNEGKAELSHETARKAKMLTGFTVCIGLIFVTALIRFV